MGGVRHRMDENMELPFENEIRLTELADSCGCAAKLEPRLLAGVLEGIGRGSDDNLLVGAETGLFTGSMTRWP